MRSKTSAWAFTLTFAIASALPAMAGGVSSLNLVPKDSFVVAQIRLGDLRSNPMSARLFEETDKVCAGEASEFLAKAGLDPRKDVDLIIASAAPGSGENAEPRVLVAAEGRFQLQLLADAVLAKGGIMRKTGSGSYYRLPMKDSKDKKHDEPGAVAFVDSHLILAGSEPAVAAALASLASGGTGFTTGGQGLGKDLPRVWPDAAAWALVDATEQNRFMHAGKTPAGPTPGGAGSDGAAAGIVSAMKSVTRVILQAAVTGDALKFSATGLIADEETRKLLEDTLRGLTALWRMSVQEKSPEMVSLIRKFEILRDAESVSVTGTLPQDLISKLSSEGKKAAE